MVYLIKDTTIHPPTAPKSNVKIKRVLKEIITPQSSPLSVLVVDLH